MDKITSELQEKVETEARKYADNALRDNETGHWAYLKGVEYALSQALPELECAQQQIAHEKRLAVLGEYRIRQSLGFLKSQAPPELAATIDSWLAPSSGKPDNGNVD